jgi:glycosyltransferase involved in cell wall biosynthesis
MRATETLSHTGLSVGHVLAHPRPDVAFVFNAANAPWVRVLRSAGVPVAVHVDGLEWKRAKWGKRAAAYYRWAEERSARWADAVIADSVGIAEHLTDQYGIRAQFIPYGAPTTDAASSRLNSLGLTAHQYHLIVARFEPENHVAELVQGYTSSTCRFPLIVVGDAPYAARYRARVLEAAARDPRVNLLGSVWDNGLLDSLYGHALTYLHGHSVGGTNPSLLRAMGAGAPVIAWDVNFNREVAGAAGRYVRSPRDVGQQVEWAEADPSGAAARGREGQADVVARYRWSEVADGYEALASAISRR